MRIEVQTKTPTQSKLTFSGKMCYFSNREDETGPREARGSRPWAAQRLRAGREGSWDGFLSVQGSRAAFYSGPDDSHTEKNKWLRSVRDTVPSLAPHRQTRRTEDAIGKRRPVGTTACGAQAKGHLARREP